MSHPVHGEPSAPGSMLAPPDLHPLNSKEFRALRDIVRTHTGIALDDSKRQMLVARLGRRLRHHELDNFGAYLDLLRNGDPRGEELQALISRITTNTTKFFRESHHFDYLKSEVFELQASRTDPIRIWSCAASSGEEPYSIAMAAWESFGTSAPARVEITASDIDQTVLRQARQGVYEAQKLARVEPARWKPHFLRGTGRAAGCVRASPRLGDLIDFLPLNLAAETWPDIGCFDVIFCRNVIIYFDAEVRRTLLDRLARQLKPGGYLMLGHSESIPPSDKKLKCVFRTTYQLRGPETAAAGASRVENLVAVEGKSRKVTLPFAVTESSDPPRPQYDISIAAGDVFVSAEGRTVRTCLGSCVAACLFDAEAGVGGMNHFALPTSKLDGPMSCRYGVHAMEVLINKLMKLGANRRRLHAKIFGACEILKIGNSETSVAAQNTAFILEFLETENIPMLAQRLGGERALEVLFDTGTGKARARTVGGHRVADTLADEAGYRARLGRT